MQRNKWLVRSKLLNLLYSRLSSLFIQRHMEELEVLMRLCVVMYSLHAPRPVVYIEFQKARWQHKESFAPLYYSRSVGWCQTYVSPRGKNSRVEYLHNSVSHGAYKIQQENNLHMPLFVLDWIQQKKKHLFMSLYETGGIQRGCTTQCISMEPLLWLCTTWSQSVSFMNVTFRDSLIGISHPWDWFSCMPF